MVKTIEEMKNELGGRPKSKEKKVRVSTYLNKNDLVLLQNLSSSNNESLSYFIRKTLLKYITIRMNEDLSNWKNFML